MEGVFIKGYFTKIINKVIASIFKKKFGYDPEITITNLEVSTTEKDNVYVSITAAMTKEQLEILIEEVTR